MSQGIATVFFAIVVLWGVLVVVSHIFYRLTLGFSVMPIHFTRGLRGRGIKDAHHAAEERRQKLRTFLQEYGEDQGVPMEFLEIPPGFPQVQVHQFERTAPIAVWHTAHLRWQRKEDHCLLAERVMDTIATLKRSERSLSAVSPVGVRLERLPR